MRVDIVIVGGGIVGSAVAYFLARTGRAGKVAVIEPDPSYEFSDGVAHAPHRPAAIDVKTDPYVPSPTSFQSCHLFDL